MATAVNDDDRQIKLKSLITPERKDSSITIKMIEKEKSEIQKKADLYAGGNMSAWLRYAALNHTPKKKELIKI